MAPVARRPLDDDQPDGYLESDRDYVLNNLEWCVEMLDRATGGDLTARAGGEYGFDSHQHPDDI